MADSLPISRCAAHSCGAFTLEKGRLRPDKKFRHHIIEPGKHAVSAIHQMGDEIFVEAAEHREILPHGLHRAHDGAGMRGAVHGILDAHEPRETGGQPREQGPVHVAARAGREIVDEPLAPKAGVKRRKIRLKLAGRLPEDNNGAAP